MSEYLKRQRQELIRSVHFIFLLHKTIHSPSVDQSLFSSTFFDVHFFILSRPYSFLCEIFKGVTYCQYICIDRPIQPEVLCRVLN